MAADLVHCFPLTLTLPLLLTRSPAAEELQATRNAPEKRGNSCTARGVALSGGDRRQSRRLAHRHQPTCGRMSLVSLTR